MRVLITGAMGFIGRSTVLAALDRGHEVGAVVRPSAPITTAEWSGRDGVHVIRADLADLDADALGLAGWDALVHLAAKIAGTERTVLHATVEATERLLAALAGSDVRRVILASSIAVYDHVAASVRGVVDEMTPIEADPKRRDVYCRAKLRQEAMVSRWADATGAGHLILRPGVVYGPRRLWTHRLGVRLHDRLWATPWRDGLLPLTHVSDCADALVRGVEATDARSGPINIVSHEGVSRRFYLRCIQSACSPRPCCMRTPTAVLRLLDRSTKAQFAARFGSFRYEHALASERLGWSPRVDVRQGIEAALA